MIYKAKHVFCFFQYQPIALHYKAKLYFHNIQIFSLYFVFSYMFTRSLLPEIDNDYLDLQQAERELANLLDIVYSNAKTVADRAIQFYMGK